MAPSITNELNPTPPKTGGDSYFEPTVMEGAGVVNTNSIHDMMWIVTSLYGRGSKICFLESNFYTSWKLRKNIIVVLVL